MEEKRLAIVGIFYDGYYDLWEDFLELFSKFWPDCPYPKYIVDINKNLEFGNDYDFTVIHAGDGAEYSRKVQTALDTIDADYFCLLLEDFYMGENVKKNPFPAIIDFMNCNSLEYYSMPLKEFQDAVAPRPKLIKGEKIEKVTIDEEYPVCCQPAVWSRGFLKKCIGHENYNAWIFEGIYVKSKAAHREDFVKMLCIDNSNPLHLYHGALQGKIVPTTYKHFKNIGYDFKNHREILSEEKYKKHIRKIQIKRYTPIKIQKLIKKYFHTNSVIDKYDEDIRSLMRKMNVE